MTDQPMGTPESPEPLDEPRFQVVDDVPDAEEDQGMTDREVQEFLDAPWSQHQANEGTGP